MDSTIDLLAAGARLVVEVEASYRGHKQAADAVDRELARLGIRH
jgi:hypothetical protein